MDKNREAFVKVLLLITALVLINNVNFEYENSIEVLQIQAQAAADFSKNEILLGSSHNVFIGKVLRQVGNKEREAGPETQFEVEVIDNIKGKLEGSIIVNQHGGYKDGVLYTLGDGDVVFPNTQDEKYLLESGVTYLLATRYNSKENWHTLNFHPNARKLISKDKSAGKEELKSLALNDEKVKKFKEAYKNEILLDADIKNNNARNSFKSLEAKMKEKQEKKTGEAQLESADTEVSTSTEQVIEPGASTTEEAAEMEPAPTEATSTELQTE